MCQLCALCIARFRWRRGPSQDFRSQFSVGAPAKKKATSFAVVSDVAVCSTFVRFFILFLRRRHKWIRLALDEDLDQTIVARKLFHQMMYRCGLFVALNVFYHNVHIRPCTCSNANPPQQMDANRQKRTTHTAKQMKPTQQSELPSP